MDVKSQNGVKVYPNNDEWQANYPPSDDTNPGGLEDGKKVGLTCKNWRKGVSGLPLGRISINFSMK